MASLVAPCPALQPRRSSAVASSFFRAPAPATACADRVSFDPSRVLMQADASRDGKRRRRHGSEDDDVSRASKKQAVGRVASPAAHLSCARIRPFVRASRPKEATQVTACPIRGDAQDVIKKQNTGGSISCKKIEPALPASHPKKQTPSSTHVSAVAHGGVKKPKAGENVPCTGSSRGILRKEAYGMIKTKRETRERVQATATTSIPPLSHPASATKVRNEAQCVIKTKQEASERAQATVTKSIPQVRPLAPAANHQDPHAQQAALRAALAAARQARDRRQQNVYQQEREEARRELDKVVRTVFFDDPYITLEDALMP